MDNIDRRIKAQYNQWESELYELPDEEELSLDNGSIPVIE
jgi:hypothetical protein